MLKTKLNIKHIICEKVIFEVSACLKTIGRLPKIKPIKP